MKLLDTNVVVYAIGGPHPYREPCRRLFQEIAKGNDAYAIDVELLQEVLYIYSYRAESDRALRVFDYLLRIFPDPLPVRREEVVKARELLGRHKGLAPRDTIHLAVALTYSLEGVVTTDRDVAGVREVRCFNPSDLYPG